MTRATSGPREAPIGPVRGLRRSDRPDHLRVASRPGRSEPTAPAGSPNVVVILVDDLGFADIGPYGSEIATPHLDRLARDGVSFTNYHTTPLCSPSRAALLTGLNPHKAGFAFPANADPGYPAYAFALPDNAPTLAETLRDRGLRDVRGRQVAPGRRPAAARRGRTRAPGRASAASTATSAAWRASPRCTRRTGWSGTTPRTRCEEFPDGLLPDRRPDRPGDRDDHAPCAPPTRASRSSSTSPTRRCTDPMQAKAPTSPTTPGSTTRAGTTSARSGSAGRSTLGPVRDGHGAAAGQPRARSWTCRPGQSRAPSSSAGSPATWRSTRRRSRRWTPASAGCSSTLGATR